MGKGGSICVTNKQKRFCDEYLVDHNATRAYKIAYPGVKNDHSASVLASRLLAKVEVKTYINTQLAKISDKNIADAKEVMQYLTSVLRGKSESQVVVVEGVGDGVSKARRFNKNPEEKDRLKAAELLGKRYSLFKDNMTLDVEPITIVNDLKE